MQLKMVQQTASVDEFVEEFEMLASQIPGITDEQYMGLFLGGLKEEIRLEVQTLDLSTCYNAVSMAWNVERKLVKAGVLKPPIIGRKQSFFSGNSWQSNSVTKGGRYTGGFLPRNSQNVLQAGLNEKAREVQKGERGPNRGIRNLSY